MSEAAKTRRVNNLPRNTLILLVGNAGGAVLLFALSVLMGRLLGADGVGIYAAAMAWVYPLALLAEFGLATLLTREIAQSENPAGSGGSLLLVNRVVEARLILGGSGTLLLILAAPLISSDPPLQMALAIAAPLVMIQPFFSTFTAIYKAHGVMLPAAALNISALAAQTILTYLVLAAGGGVIAALVVNTAAAAGQLAAAWWIYRWRFRVQTATHVQPAPTLMMLLRRAYPFALAAVSVALQTRIGFILLEQLSTPAEVGYLSTAVRFTEAARLIPNAFFGALLPALAALAADRLRLAQTMRRGMMGLALFGLGAGVSFGLLALPLLRLTYGDAFAPAAPVLAVMGWALLFSLPRGGRTLYLYALGQEARINRVNGIAVTAQTALCLLLIPPLGALGVATASIASEGAALALLRHDT